MRRFQCIAAQFQWFCCLLAGAAALSFLANGSVWGMTLDDLDDDRKTDWSQAGYPGGIPDITDNVIRATEAGVVADGATDNAQALRDLIEAVTLPAVVYFPPGTYRFQSAVALKSGVVLRGAGSEQTHLQWSSSDGCLTLQGSTNGGYVAILAGLSKGSDQVVVADASRFEVGQGGEIRQEDLDAVDPGGEWADPSVGWVPDHVMGQMVKIVAIQGNTLTIDPSLNIAFSAAHQPEIRPVRFVRDVGVEDLHIQRLSSGASSSNIQVSRAADCWFRGIESEQTHKYHFSVTQSIHLEIRECYIHDAYSKGDGGAGYGTSLATYTTAVLVENNIFSDLRHSMIIQLGVNGCVFGYNYAQRNYSDDGWDKTYISVHGHYPYMNLFEGNIVGFAGLADYWGASGPGNTLFRNRIMGTDRHETFGPYRGIAVDDYSHKQNIIGNELIGEQTRISFDGEEDASLGTAQEVLVHGNNVHGTIGWDPALGDHALPDSFYLAAKPSFFGTLPWPALGPDQMIGQGTIPALERFDRGAPVPQPDDVPVDNPTAPVDDPSSQPDTQDAAGGGSGGCFVTTLEE